MTEFPVEVTPRGPGYTYSTDALLISGDLQRPVESKIERQAPVSLNDDRGGHLVRRMEQYDADELISFQSGYTRVSGSRSLQHHGWVTLSASVLEDLNVFDVITAKRVVAQVSTEHQLYGSIPKVMFLGTRFEHLRVGGYAVQIELDLGICGDKPEGDRSYLEDHHFLDRVQHQIENIARANDIPLDFRYLKDSYGKKLAEIEVLRKRANGGDERNIYGPVQCSLIKSIAPIPIPGVRTIGNLILVPDFGIVSLAEVEVCPTFLEGRLRPELKFTLKMLGIRMGCIGHGTIAAAEVSVSGAKRFGGGGGRAELAQQPPMGSSNLSKEKPGSAEGTSVTRYESPTAGGPTSLPTLNIEGGSPSPRDETLEVSEEPDPPRSAYALLKCDDAVIASVEFPLTVGLSKDPDPDVFGDQKLERPSSSVGPYTLQVQITADGFQIGYLEQWRNQLSVTADNPYPSITMHLTPEMQPTKNLWSRTITVVYSVNGHTIGVAMRSVAIVRRKEYLDQIERQEQDSSATFSIPTDTVAPDLTVTIVPGASSGRLLWTLTTPWKEIATPSNPLEIDVGGDGDGPKEYARQLVDSVNANEGKATLYKHLIGRGTEVGDLVPAMFWEVLRAVAEKSSSKVPTILILSAEPYIPWELAVLKPPLDPTLPPFLGAQAIVGRWVLANRGPKLPPPREQQAKTIAVVSGVYDHVPGWKRLQEAEAEAKNIQTKWRAVPVDARTDPVLKCIDGTPPSDVLHFALHGIYDPNSTQNGLILVDGQQLDPTTVKGATLTYTPFVFLNACQVGSGNSVLGDYSGMAAAFLHAGASGVVAPLWSVKDTIAREIAERFYEKTFSGTTPAEFLRSERGQFVNSPKVVSATCLAYQFFGHPAMRLVR